MNPAIVRLLAIRNSLSMRASRRTMLSWRRVPNGSARMRCDVLYRRQFWTAGTGVGHPGATKVRANGCPDCIRIAGVSLRPHGASYVPLIFAVQVVKAYRPLSVLMASFGL